MKCVFSTTQRCLSCKSNVYIYTFIYKRQTHIYIYIYLYSLLINDCQFGAHLDFLLQRISQLFDGLLDMWHPTTQRRCWTIDKGFWKHGPDEVRSAFLIARSNWYTNLKKWGRLYLWLFIYMYMYMYMNKNMYTCTSLFTVDQNPVLSMWLDRLSKVWWTWWNQWVFSVSNPSFYRGNVHFHTLMYKIRCWNT